MTSTRPFQVGKMYRTDGMPIRLRERDGALVLADRERHRTPLMMRDNVTCTTCNDTGRHPAGIWCPDCNSKNLRKDSQVTDAQIEMRDQIARDQLYRRTHSGNMPGYRYAADTEATRASKQQLHDAYQEYETRLTSMWKDVSPDVDWSTGAGNPARNFGKLPPRGRCVQNE